MKRISLIVVGTAALVFSTTASAQPNLSSRGGSMERAIQRVTINAAKNPQAPGLANAAERLAQNAEKHAENNPGPRAAGAQGPERADRPDRPQLVLSPDIADRPLPSGLADRPLPPGVADRPLPRGLVDRPQPPGRGRGR